jgi:hypothetical protein
MSPPGAQVFDLRDNGTPRVWNSGRLRLLERMLQKGRRSELHGRTSGVRNSERFGMLECMLQKGRRLELCGNIQGLRESENGSDMDRKDEGLKAR